VAETTAIYARFQLAAERRDDQLPDPIRRDHSRKVGMAGQQILRFDSGQSEQLPDLELRKPLFAKSLDRESLAREVDAARDRKGVGDVVRQFQGHCHVVIIADSPGRARFRRFAV
jgi:hypothetical protein